MKIAILGGTGRLGEGLALRLLHGGHDVVIGSRDATKARDVAGKMDRRLIGMTNSDASEWCEIALAAVPYKTHTALIETLQSQLQNKIIIDATVPIDPDNLLRIKTESGRSAAEETATIVKGASVFAAFQTISHRVLRQIDVSHDILVAGSEFRKPIVMDLIRGMALRPVDAGPIEAAGLLERMTVLLLSINKANKVKESELKVVGIFDNGNPAS